MLGTSAGDLVHELQKERGLSAGFLGDGSNAFHDRLRSQRTAADERLEIFLAHAGALEDGLSPSLTVPLDQGRKRLAGLSALRGEVSSQKVTAAEAVRRYTETNATLLGLVRAIGLSSTHPELLRRSVAYSALLQGKERAGIERAVLANTFAKGAFGPGMYAKFIGLLSQQEAYFGEFVAIAVPEDRDRFEATLRTPAVARVEKYREVARESTSGLEVDSTAWFDAATTRIELLKTLESEAAAGVRNVSVGVARSAMRGAIVIGAVVFTLLVATTLAARSILGSVLGAIEDLASRLADMSEGDADLTRRVEVERQDELGAVGEAFNRFVAGIQALVLEIQTRESSIQAASVDLSNVAEGIAGDSSRMDSDAARVSESTEALSGNLGGISTEATNSSQNLVTMAAAVEELSTNLENSAERVASISRSVRETSDSLGEVSQTVDAISDHAGKAAEVAEEASRSARNADEMMSALGAAASEIGQVVDTINDIAGQTNLLALNATIEAASAGEAGRGFAVVANEVKELAKQTAQATESIRAQVESMQRSASGSVDAIQGIVRVIEEVNGISHGITHQVAEQRSVTERISESVATLAQDSEVVAQSVQECSTVSRDTASSVEGLSRSSTEIANQLEEASQGADSIGSSMKGVASSITGAADGARAVNQSSVDLQGLSKELGELVGRFRA